MSRYILSIDQGTTSCRAIVFDKAGKPLGCGQEEFKQFFPQPGWVEHDPIEIIDVQVHCIKSAIADACIKPSEIACVGITNQRETTVVWNRATGKPVYPAIVWQCRRTQTVAESMKKDGQWYRDKTGLIPDAYFSGPKISWILDHVPGARRQAERGELAFGTIDSWLIWNLSRERRHVTEPSNASRTLLFNIHNLSWDDEILARLEIPKVLMPEVISSNGIFGTTCGDKLGFEAPICGNLGDQQAALFGQGCFREGMAKCTYGTGSFLLANIGASVKYTPGMLTTVAWKLEGDSCVYALEGAMFIAGAAIQWLRDGLGIIASSSETEALANSLAGNEGVYFVPALVGLGSPFWDSDVRGTITGLTRGSGRAHFVRAALESMAFQVADVEQAMTHNAVNILELRVDGGAARNKFLLQFQADLLGIPVVQSAQVESTAWGVAGLAGIAAGVISSIDDMTSGWKAESTFRQKVGRLSEYKGWKSALAATFAAVGKSVPVLQKDHI